MITYFKFKVDINNTRENDKKQSVLDFIIKILSFILPKANPDFEDKYDNVIVWYIEYDDLNGYINREIGLDSSDQIIVKAPFFKNLGFWVDTDLKLSDYYNFKIEYITSNTFKDLWEMKVKNAL